MKICLDFKDVSSQKEEALQELLISIIDEIMDFLSDFEDFSE